VVRMITPFLVVEPLRWIKAKTKRTSNMEMEMNPLDIDTAPISTDTLPFNHFNVRQRVTSNPLLQRVEWMEWKKWRNSPSITRPTDAPRPRMRGQMQSPHRFQHPLPRHIPFHRTRR